MNYAPITAMLEKTFMWSLSRTFSREEAEELTQEIMFQALKSISLLRNDEKFEPWFWRLADITLKVFRRGKAKERSAISFDEVPVLSYEDDYSFEVDAEYTVLRKKIAQMSAVYRDILVMHYYENMTCKAISHELGLPEGTVTYRLSLGRSKLSERYDQMNESVLKPARLKIRITGIGNYNGDDRPFPYQYIEDALSQNILWHSYREPKKVEELSELTGVPAYYIEERIENLIKRDALIRPQGKTVQTNFLIFDKETNKYSHENIDSFVQKVSDKFYLCSKKLTDTLMESDIFTAGRSHDEILCLLSVMLLESSVSKYRPCEYRPYERKYDGGMWEYTGFTDEDEPFALKIRLGIEKSMNNFENGKLSHYSFHFSPFKYRRMMFSHEIDICKAVLDEQQITDNQKESAASMIANGYLSNEENGSIICAVPVLTKAQKELFSKTADDLFADFFPFYQEEVKKYLKGYIRLFPRHLRDAAERNGFHVFIALFKAVAADWIERGKITIPSDSFCDILIQQ